jgi:plastocyanin
VATRQPAFGFAPAAALAALVCALLTGAPTQATDGEIVLTIKDHQFVPTELAAPAGQKFKIVVRNADSVAAEFESVDFHREKLVQAGREIAVYIGPLDPGRYEFFDDLHPESRGHLIVK